MFRFTWIIGIPVLLGLLTLPAAVHAQAQQVQAHFQASTPLEADPGGVLTTVVGVFNPAESDPSLIPSVDLPSRWSTVFPEQPFALAPGERTTRLVSLSLPAEAPAGEYTIYYSLRDSMNRTVLATDSVVVAVRAKRQVRLDLADPPRFVAAGMPYTATVLVSNEGNVEEEVVLLTAAEPGFTASPDSVRLSLAPFSVRPVTITVQTPDDVPERLRHALRVSGYTAGGAPLHLSEAIDVLPEVSRSGDVYRRLPVEASFRGISEAGAFHPQGELSGRTASFFQADDELAFRFRGPNQLQTSVLGEMDEYWMRYTTPGYRLHAGDDYYALSPLTETGIRGLGFRGDAALGRWDLGGYAQQTRYYSPGEQQLGAYTSYRLSDRLNLGANYLGKSGRLDGHLATLRAEAEPWRNVHVDAEAGADLGSAKDNAAFSLNLRGQLGRLDFSGRMLQAGDNFASNYRSVHFLSGSARLQVARRLYLESAFFGQQRNAFANPLLRLDQRTRNLRAGARYGSLLSLFYYYGGRFEDGIAERRDHALQADLRIPIRSASLSSRFELGRRAYHRLDNPFNYYRYDLTLYVRPFSAHSLQATFTHDFDRNPFSGEAQERLGWNVAAGFTPVRRLRASAFLTHSWYASGVAASFTNADLLVSYTLPADHRIVVRGRMLRFGQPGADPGHAFSIQYIVPLNLPVGRVRSRGSIQGRVYDVATGEGLEDVLLYVGDHAVLSGDGGQYAFLGIPPDAYQLQVERTSIGVERTPAQPMPAPIQLEGGRSVTLDVGVTAAATLSGNVVRYEFEESKGASASEGPPVPAGGQRGVVVELSDGEEVQRRLTNAQGAFSFTNLRPGVWTLTVLRADLPGYFLDRETFTVDLEPGGRHQAEVRVLPRERSVRMIEGGKLTLQSSGEDAAQPKIGEPVAEEPQYHVVRPSDGGLMNLARQLYGDPALWPKIWQANLGEIENPDDLRVGMRLRIPPKAPLTPTERGALQAYRRESGGPGEL